MVELARRVGIQDIRAYICTVWPDYGSQLGVNLHQLKVVFIQQRCKDPCIVFYHLIHVHHGLQSIFKNQPHLSAGA